LLGAKAQRQSKEFLGKKFSPKRRCSDRTKSVEEPRERMRPEDTGNRKS